VSVPTSLATAIPDSPVDALLHAAAPLSRSLPSGERSPSNVQNRVGWLVSDEEIVRLRINNTIFRIPQRYVGYYDTKDHSVLNLHFLLPAVTPVEPFTIGATQEHNPRQVADVGILASKWPNFDRYLDRLAAEGKLSGTDYRFGLRELAPSTIPGPTQNEPNPDAREFYGVADGQRVLIYCSGYREGGLLMRCAYTFSLHDYALSIDIPESFLPGWRDILEALIAFAISHEKH
jgi:hypothetical protein